MTPALAPDAPRALVRSLPARSKDAAAAVVASSAAPERRTWTADDGCRIIALVDVVPIARGNIKPLAPNVLWALAVRRMQRCVRPGDRMCMLGGARLAVYFGNGAHRIAPSTLGRRLVRAMGERLSVGGASLDLEVAVGIGAGSSGAEAAELMSAAIASVKSGRCHPLGPTEASSGVARPFVAVAHVRGGKRYSLVHRVLFPLLEDPDAPNGDGTRSAIRSTLSADREMAATREASTAFTSVFRVLVVDPAPCVPGACRLAVEAVAGATRNLGMRSTVSRASDPTTVVLDHYVVEPHAVVIALEPDGLRRPVSPGEPWPWERAAQLTRALCDTGTTVLAVSVGCSAATVAACVEQGAIGLLDVEALPHELARLAGSGQLRGVSVAEGVLGAGHGGARLEKSPRRFPPPYDALVHLTPSERRVLFHMMEGCSAAGMARELFVSLTTVRAHIRGILRKLNVSSQLAAVALANGALSEESPIAP
ncbi:MAG: LuxR C-terminal-related transcriptional regulator [Acidimicrobiales bacterium]